MEPVNSELPQNSLTTVGEVAISSPVVMAPSLLMALSTGDCKTLKKLLNRGDSPVRPAAVAPQVVVDVHDADTLDVNDVTNASLAVQPTSTDAAEEDPDQSNRASNGSLASQEITEQPAGNSTDGIFTGQQASSTDGGTDQLGSNNNGSSAVQQAPPDAVQRGVDQPPVPPSESLLDGVTPQGDTALHVLAKSGSSGATGDKFLDCVYMIYNKAKYLLDARNKTGDTPLHCAARTGNFEMVSYLVDLAKCKAGHDNEKLKVFLRKRNKLGETVLHEAIRSGKEDILNFLLTVDSELARVPSEGTSPLYLAILLEKYDIAQKLYAKDNQLSYSGPDGQNALHAAVIRNREMTKKLLQWKGDLTEQADKNGSTPLHFAASIWTFRRRFLCMSYVLNSDNADNPVDLLLQANPAQLYQSDNKGFFPIHVAASSGEKFTAIKLINKSPDIAGLRDAKGRTFLHVAVEGKKWNIVAYACQTRKLEWILNMQDDNGNTALHLAVQHGVLPIFCSLLRKREVHLNLTNNKGETPLDLSYSKIPAGFLHGWGSRKLINGALKFCRAMHGNRRADHFEEQYIPQEKPEDKVKESDKLTNSTRTLGIGSVLIVTVTFGATFAPPGGYKADGTPALAGRYVFDAFVMANAVAFVCSALATINLMYSGMAMVDLPMRRGHFNISLFFAFSSVTSLAAAFALGVYLVLAPVAHMTAVAICALASVVSLVGFTEPLKALPVANALCLRLRNRTLQSFARVIFVRTLLIYWPMVIIFGWAAISTKYGHR